MNNIDSAQKYRLMYDLCMSKLQTSLQEEYLQYGQFLEECDISTLPDNAYKDGKALDYGEVRKLYDEWLKSREKE